MGSETKAHPQRWDNFGNRRSAMDRAGKYLTLPYLTIDHCLGGDLFLEENIFESTISPPKVIMSQLIDTKKSIHTNFTILRLSGI